jgi:hypothetical protein
VFKIIRGTESSFLLFSKKRPEAELLGEVQRVPMLAGPQSNNLSSARSRRPLAFLGLSLFPQGIAPRNSGFCYLDCFGPRTWTH